MSRAFTKERDDAPEPALVLRPRRIYGDVMPPPPDDRGVAGFGATVVVEGAGPSARTFTIVAPDASDLAAGRIGFDSPLAQALLGARAGQRVTWHRPVGDATLRIVSVTYEGAA
ncbi:MAG TPA: GreA/GreB family elongation factor [Candidatus Elarobacter sp.]|jgi:transcription elongation GreA/GreB family factor|nr:GreA/GreB family elongation factor [Candidatus Elarobacter sp.]